MSPKTFAIFAAVYTVIALLLIGVPFAGVFYTACASVTAVKAIQAMPESKYRRVPQLAR